MVVILYCKTSLLKIHVLTAIVNDTGIHDYTADIECIQMNLLSEW
jgi:hypothetical protein